MPVYGPPAREVIRSTLGCVDIDEASMAFPSTTGVPVKISTTEDADDPANGVPLPGCIALYAHGNQILARTVEDGPVAEIQTNTPAVIQSTATGSLNVGRRESGSCLLADGRVFICGGIGGDGSPLDSCEIYDPETGLFTPTGAMNVARNSGTNLWLNAVLLNNGKVLIASQNTAELYDPVAGTCAYTGSPLYGLDGNELAVKLDDGMVLVASGDNVGGCQLYDQDSETFIGTGALSTNRMGGWLLIKLNNGNVLACGGRTGPGAGDESVACEIYDPNTETWSATGDLSTPREFAAASVLSNGTVLISGGIATNSSTVKSSCEIYTPGDGTWAATGDMAVPRCKHVQFTLPDSSTLALGGQGFTYPAYTPIQSVEMFASGSWSEQADMLAFRRYGSFVRLDDTVLAAGGGADLINPDVLSSAEIYGSQATVPLKTDVGVMMSLRGGVPIPDAGYATVFLSIDGTMKIRKADGSIVDVSIPADLSVSSISTTGAANIGGAATVMGNLSVAQAFNCDALTASGSASIVGDISCANMNVSSQINAASIGVGVVSCGSFSTNVVTKTEADSPYTATNLDFTIIANPATLETLTVNLPPAASRSGIIYTFKLTGLGTLIIDGDGSETIDGATTKTLATQFLSCVIQSDGSNWIVIG